jgi:hypothetical protein
LKLGLAAASLVTLAGWLAGSGCSSLVGDRRSQQQREGRLPATITRTNYHGWTNAIVMRGGGSEVIIVPAIGRIMQFQFAGEPGPFWENRALHGQVHPPRATNWLNFGGDKTWPAPEAAWPKPFGGWLPPAAFDSMPVEAKIDRDQVILTSPVDPDYGIRVVRRIYLGPGAGAMTVSTRYEKVSGEEQKVGIWTITQLREPQGVFSRVPLADPLAGTDFRRTGRAPEPELFTNGFRLMSKAPPPDLRVLPGANGRYGLVSLTRNPQAAHKIGLANGRLLWVGERVLLRIDSWRYEYLEYPDGGSNGEIYTNPDPLPYVELEIMGPLSMMKRGSMSGQAVTYTLLRRTRATPEDEARASFERADWLRAAP